MFELIENSNIRMLFLKRFYTSEIYLTELSLDVCFLGRSNVNPTHKNCILYENF